MLLEGVLIIFVKYPEPGSVKTRLAKRIGKFKAAIIYRLFVEAILARTKDLNFKRIIFYHPPNKRKEIIDWLGPKLNHKIYSQKGDSLGEKLSNAFQFVFSKGAKRVIAIGTDSPTLDKKLIIKAFKKLKKVSCVLGPALDGGYYLVGLSSFYPEIFQGVKWGTGEVLEKTKYKLRKLGLEFSLLNPESDIDSLNDLCLLKRKLQRASKVNLLGLAPILKILNRDFGMGK